MAISFTISSVDWDKVDADNVRINTLHWRVTQTEGDYSATYYEATSPDQERIVPKSTLSTITKPQVIQWVRDRIGAEREAEILAGLQAQIDEQKNPTRGSFEPVDA